MGVAEDASGQPLGLDQYRHMLWITSRNKPLTCLLCWGPLLGAPSQRPGESVFVCLSGGHVYTLTDAIRDQAIEPLKSAASPAAYSVSLHFRMEPVGPGGRVMRNVVVCSVCGEEWFKGSWPNTWTTRSGQETWDVGELTSHVRTHPTAHAQI